MKESQEIFNAIVNNIEDDIHSSIQSAIQTKFDQAMDVKRVAVASEIYNGEVVEEALNIEEASLSKPTSTSDLSSTLKDANKINATEDQYMSWYSKFDRKMEDAWRKMLEKDRVYKKAYEDGKKGKPENNPFKNKTLASAIWDNQYAIGEMDN